MNDIRVFGFIAKSPYHGKKDAGYFNGYVAVRKDIVEANTSLFCPYRKDPNTYWIPDWDLPVYVHCGITYVDKWHKQFFFMPVTELPKLDEMENYIILGWDYAHLGDNWEKYPFNVVEEEVKETVQGILNVLDRL